AYDAPEVDRVGYGDQKHDDLLPVKGEEPGNARGGDARGALDRGGDEKERIPDGRGGEDLSPPIGSAEGVISCYPEEQGEEDEVSDKDLEERERLHHGPAPFVSPQKSYEVREGLTISAGRPSKDSAIIQERRQRTHLRPRGRRNRGRS